MSTRDAAFMGIMRRTLTERLYRELKVPVAGTKGYITKYTRVELLHLPRAMPATPLQSHRDGTGSVLGRQLLSSLQRGSTR